jgi:integrase
MTTLADNLDRYLTTRRALGFDLSTAARILRRFVAFADHAGAQSITPDLFMRWKASFGSANQETWAARLSAVRGFARWLTLIDPDTVTPPAGLTPARTHRPRPYIYTPAEVSRIVVQAAKLPSDYGLRGQTYSTLFGLIAVTGLRISEALSLDEDDIDLDARVIAVRRGKNGRARILPIADSVAERLQAYRCERRRLNGSGDGAFFRLDNGARPSDCAARYNFAAVSQSLGLRRPERHCKHGVGPRIHDLRHTFAVRTIISWYRKGLDPDREMSRLSTYLGHTDPNNTYWYIEAVPELMHLAAKRAERAWRKGDHHG